MLVVSPAWRGDAMRYQAIMTPPVCVPPEQMITSDATQTFTHVSMAEWALDDITKMSYMFCNVVLHYWITVTNYY